jgi:hypothetical protein
MLTGHVGYTLALEGDLAEAVKEFQSAIDLAPHCGRYFYDMGLLQRKLGNMELGDPFVARAKQLGIQVPMGTGPWSLDQHRTFGPSSPHPRSGSALPL